MDSKEKIKELINTLSNENMTKEDYKMVFDTLVRMGEAAVPYLIEVLENGNAYWYVRCRAAELLGKIGDKRALPELIKIFMNKDNNLDVRKSAIEAVATIGDKRALPELIKIFMNKDENLDVRLRAGDAIRKIKDERVVPELIKILKDREEDKEIRRLSADAIVSISSEKIPEKEMREVVMALLTLKTVSAIVYIGEPAVPYLIEVLSAKESADMQKDAGEALIGIAGRIVGRIAYGPLNKKEEDFIQALEKIEKWIDSLRKSKNLLSDLPGYVRVRRVINELNKLKRVINKLRNEVDRSTGEISKGRHFGGGGTTDELSRRFRRLRI